MNIPNLIHDTAVDQEGNFTTAWFSFLDQLITELQLNLSDEGYRLPALKTDQINQLTADKSIGSMVYDSDTNEVKVNIAGTWRVVNVT